MIKLMVAAALLSAPQPTPTRPCMTRQEVGDLIIVLLPRIVDVARERCAAMLGGDAFLTQARAADFTARLRADGRERRASAVRAMDKFGSERRPPGLSDDTVIQGVGEVVTGELFQTADATSCRNLDEILEAISAMSTPQIARLTTSLFSLSGVGRRPGDSSPSICAP